MPLTFLTDVHDHPDSTAASQPAPPFDDRERWRRPYSPGAWRVAGAAVLLLLTAFLLISTLVIALAGALSSAGVCLGVAAVVATLALRILRMGVWVSEHGLRRAGVLSTVTLRWSEVAAVRTAQQPVRWLGLPRTVQGQALVITRARDMRPLRTLLTDHNADFLGRSTRFDRAADVIEAWAAESRSH